MPLFQDLRFALRQLRRSPFYTLTVVGTLTLALGAASAMVGVLRATLLNPLPYPRPGELVQIADANLRGFKSSGLVSVLRVQDLADAASNGRKLFSGVGYFYSDDSALALDGHEPIRVPAVAVSGGFFPTLAAAPLMGRTLIPADDLDGGPQLLVISYRLWQTAFAADSSVIGRSVRLGSQLATVVGVMPPRFSYPVGIDLWHPGHILPVNFRGYRGEGSRFLRVIARLNPAETPASAVAQTDLLAHQLAAAYPTTDAAWGFSLTTLRASLFGEYRHALILLACAVGLVLLIAATNIAGLQLSRNVARAPEFALRGALGISRQRLIRQLITESLLLVLIGSAAGLVLAPVLLRVLAARLPAALLQLEKPHVDFTVALLTLAVAVIVGLLTAILPALQSTRSLAASPTRSVVSAPTGRNSRFGQGFATIQIALSLVLLTLSTVVLQGLYRLINLPLGFQPDSVQSFTIDLPWSQNQADYDKVHRIYVAAQTALAALPGVSDVAASSALPLSDFSVRRTFDIAGQPPTPHQDAVAGEGRSITPNYLSTMRIPLLAGRGLNLHDADPNVPRVFVVNHTFAARYFPNRNPIGQHLTTSSAELHVAPGLSTDRIDAGEIVGVIGDVAGTGGSLTSPVQPELYSPENGGWPHMQFVLRSTQPPSEPQIRRLITSLDSTASAGHFSTLSATLNRELLQPRLNAALLTAFAALSLLLVIIGIYGLFAFEMIQRTRELGIRLALGSSRTGIRNLLLAASLRLLAAGLAIGLAASLLTFRLLTITKLADTAAPTPPLFVGTITLISIAVLSATLIPARRAGRLNPIEIIRHP